MDRSFLTKEEVIKASRDFVCIRLATYEDKAEAKFCENLFRGRSGKLENTVFCFLAPDGKTRLTRANRGPFDFRDSNDMAKQMEMVAMSYMGKSKKQLKNSNPSLPVMKNFRLGLNVASCDLLPCVAIVGKNKTEVRAMSDTMSKIAWDPQVMGRFVFCTSIDKNELRTISGMKTSHGIFVIEPGAYGLRGKVIAQFDADQDSETIKKKMVDLADKFVVTTKNHGRHVHEGARNGVNWLTEVPVTDPGSQRAMERMEQIRQQNSKRK